MQRHLWSLTLPLSFCTVSGFHSCNFCLNSLSQPLKQKARKNLGIVALFSPMLGFLSQWMVFLKPSHIHSIVHRVHLFIIDVPPGKAEGTSDARFLIPLELNK